MPSARSLFATAIIAIVAGRLCAAQTAPARAAHFDASLLGLNVGIAVRSSSRTAIGASIGVGGNWLNYMALAGRHFSEAGGLSYEAKDGNTEQALFELFRGTVFVRRYFDEGRQLDVGLKASGFLHGDNSDDDLGGGAFVGLNVTGMWWQWRRFRLGSEVDAGRYSEGRPELGVNVAPVLVRFTIP